MKELREVLSYEEIHAFQSITGRSIQYTTADIAKEITENEAKASEQKIEHWDSLIKDEKERLAFTRLLRDKLKAHTQKSD